MEKSRLPYAPLLVRLAHPLTRLLGTGVRVLRQAEWHERERDIYRTVYGKTIAAGADGKLVLPRLPGETLASLLENVELEVASRNMAIECAVVALARFHALGFTHGDAMAENVMIDLEGGVGGWFDFETSHDADRPSDWRRADDVRALLATCLVRSSHDRFDETVRLVLDVYGDPDVTRLVTASFASVARRPLIFHLAQAGLSHACYLEVARLLKDRVRE